MQTSKTIIGMLLGLGLLAAGCWGDEEPASAPPQAAPGEAPAAATPPTLSARDRVRADLARSYPDASQAEIDCFADKIVDQVGFERFLELVAIVMQENAAIRQPEARTPEDSAGFQKLRDLGAECGISVP